MLYSSNQHIGVVRSYRRKNEIFREDDPADRVYEVIKGTVCTAKTLRDGRRQIAGFYFPGDVLGLENVARHLLAAQAITEARVRIVKKQTLNALASSDCNVADQLLALTARELVRKQDHLLSLLSTTAEERIICFLIDMVQRAPAREDHLIALPMSRLDIADYLGLTIETVSRTLWDLERRGAIKIKGYRSIVLRDQFVEEKAEELLDLFEGIKGQRPKTEGELDKWLVSPEGKAATF
jgi:CRP/FNR family transcriptional regulator, nitrogen fixation regulation protein